jgi:hypothetical protein
MSNEKLELIVLSVNAETGESKERPMSEEEMVEHKKLISEMKKQEAEAKAKAETRSSALAKLAELGLTEAEIASL